MNHPTTRIGVLVLTLITTLGLLAAAVAQDKPADTKTADKPADPKDKTADQVLKDIKAKSDDQPLVEPVTPKGVAAPGNKTGPNGATKLKREGQFIIMRKARMVPSNAEYSRWLVTFDADKDGLQDPPMFLMPCQLLEDMERIIKQNGDTTLFVLSGQIFVYKGSNYLLPTLVKIEPKRGNLKQ